MHDSPSPGLGEPLNKEAMFIIFFDWRGVVLCHGLPAGQTVTANYYSKVNVEPECCYV